MTRPKDPRATRDAQLIHLVLEHPGFDDLQFDGGSPREVFEGWETRIKNNGETTPLTTKQRSWLEGVARRLDVDLGAVNLVSSGQVKVSKKESESLQTFLSSLDRPALPPHRRPK